MTYFRMLSCMMYITDFILQKIREISGIFTNFHIYHTLHNIYTGLRDYY